MDIVARLLMLEQALLAKICKCACGKPATKVWRWDSAPSHLPNAMRWGYGGVAAWPRCDTCPGVTEGEDNGLRRCIKVHVTEELCCKEARLALGYTSKDVGVAK